MADLIAITEIHRTKTPGKKSTVPGERGTPPVVDVIKPNSPFTAPQDEADELIALGAASKAPAGTKMPEAAKATNTKTSEKAAAKQQDAKQQAPAGDPKAVADMTKAEIVAELTEREVEFKEADLKDDLAKQLTDARDAGGMV